LFNHKIDFSLFFPSQNRAKIMKV
jgi:hypothetical protein